MSPFQEAKLLENSYHFQGSHKMVKFYGMNSCFALGERNFHLKMKVSSIKVHVPHIYSHSHQDHT